MLKKFVPLVLVAILFSSPSQAKMSPVDQAMVSHKRHQLNSQTRTKSVLARVVPKHQKKFVALGNIQEDDSDDVPGPDELDLHVFYSRPRVADNKQSIDVDDDVSDYVLVRLAVARARAMAAYRARFTETA